MPLDETRFYDPASPSKSPRFVVGTPPERTEFHVPEWTAGVKASVQDIFRLPNPDSIKESAQNVPEDEEDDNDFRE
ncbi:hypothetical protein H6768_04950 [Candidatus Peribacteria bacterium]|nr:hypothetical protein [Candidatus Peribacteria bacterium]